MSENKSSIPPKPSDDPLEGYLWVYDHSKGWYEVPCEIRTSKEEPFFPADTHPLKLPVDGDLGKKPLNLN